MCGRRRRGGGVGVDDAGPQCRWFGCRGCGWQGGTGQDATLPKRKPQGFSYLQSCQQSVDRMDERLPGPAVGGDHSLFLYVVIPAKAGLMRMGYAALRQKLRSEERSVGKGCVSTCQYLVSPYP